MTAGEGIWLCAAPQDVLSKVHSDEKKPWSLHYICPIGKSPIMYIPLLSKTNAVSCFTACSQQERSTVLN